MIAGSCSSCIRRDIIVVVVQPVITRRARLPGTRDRSPSVQGWVLDFDHQSGAWHIFLFGFLRDVIIPSEHMVVTSCIPMIQCHWRSVIYLSQIDVAP